MKLGYKLDENDKFLKKNTQIEDGRQIGGGDIEPYLATKMDGSEISRLLAQSSLSGSARPSTEFSHGLCLNNGH